ncbi:MAG: hypothetical protein ACI9EP_001363 [Oceanospirillaceae bacterium]|jgi:hypothetical protein
MVYTRTLIYLAAKMSVLLGCIALPFIGTKLARKLMAEDQRWKPLANKKYLLVKTN